MLSAAVSVNYSEIMVKWVFFVLLLNCYSKIDRYFVFVIQLIGIYN